MSLKIKSSNSFKKDVRIAEKRGHNLDSLRKVVALLISQIPLPLKYRDHTLSGSYKGFRECHVEPDWLLIYRVDQDELILFLFRTGFHSDLF